ncbi:TonB-dependent receptor [Mucilaginibacter sp. cycad4]|uniref:SusC/RagA family TonB-linked outer membrane protein n=1 Tax=Mucilaginibacter sp. cycad4 TaxID=3342096 RepID=UPI002AAACF7A|nr:TonB-dependent receptor [Mucilaginibacter gossypii]WPV02134.1 TonB-dependent receptor [Mucilaginibacter gossypii]
MGQSRQVTGKVIDALSKETIIGANIKAKGIKTTTVTDVNGNFAISVPNGSVLQISYVGYSMVEVVADAEKPMIISLSPAKTDLDEVVVVAYGTQKKVTVTGAVSTVNAKVFEDRGVVSNPLAALQGQVPGVIVTRSTAAPGQEGWNLQIRGASSLNPADPLIIVDGITQVNGSGLNSINPSDIDNISFLKDAAAAIYGSRAAGGVILITTKRAKNGKPVIEYNSSFSLKKMGLRPHFLMGTEYGTLMLQAISNSSTGGVADPTWIWTKYANSWINPPASGYIDKTTAAYKAGGETIGFTDVYDYTYFNTNPYDILWGDGKATSTQQDVSFSGRTETLGYRASFGYLNDGSLLKWGDNSNKRYNARLNLDFKPSDRINIQTNISLEKNNVVVPTRSDQINVSSQPGFPVATINGKPYAWGTQPARNWLLELGGDNNTYVNRVLANIKATLKLTRDLNFVALAGYNWANTDNQVQYKSIPEIFNYTETYQYQANPTPAQSYYTKGTVNDVYYNTNAYLEYHKTVAKLHDFALVGGGSYERDEFDNFSTTTSYLASNDVPALGLSLGDNTTHTNGEIRNHYALASGFGRFNYAYDNKYLLELVGRYDGTSRFSENNRWIGYGGVSLGWRMTQEKFMKNITFVSELKPRFSYGSTGNPGYTNGANGIPVGIGLYDYLQLVGINNTGAILGGYTSRSVTAGPSGTLVSLTRTWERVNSTNLGIDLGLFNSKLTGSFEYYWKRNNNFLVNPVYPVIIGASAPSENNGRLKVWGWEASLGWKDKIGSVAYYVSGTLTNNNNEVISYGGANIVASGQRTIEGYPINSFFGLKYDGRIQNVAEATDYAKYVSGNSIGMPGTTQIIPGDNRYKDLNGDGTLTNAGAHQYLLGKKDANGNPIADGDIEYLGSPDPKYVFGLNLGASYKGFDFSAIFQGVGKKLIYRRSDWSVPFLNISQGITNWWVGKTWTPDNPNAPLPILAAQTNKGFNPDAYNYQMSDWALQDGAYIRLKNVVIGYTFKPELMKKVGISRLRLYVSGSDLWESTKIQDAYDPEAIVGNGAGRYPFFRLYSIGLNVTL